MADKYQGEVTKMLHKYNVFIRHEKSIPIIKDKRVISWNCPDRSTPDLSGGLVHHINVEVKTARNGRFDFNLWTKGQMEYAENWREIRGCEFWLAVVFVLNRPIHGRLKRATFLVPFPAVVSAINLLDGIQKSIPYEYNKGMKIRIQEEGLTAEQLWKDFALDYNSKDKWSLPERHPFRKMYLNQKPYLYDLL